MRTLLESSSPTLSPVAEDSGDKDSLCVLGQGHFPHEGLRKLGSSLYSVGQRGFSHIPPPLASSSYSCPCSSVR